MIGKITTGNHDLTTHRGRLNVLCAAKNRLQYRMAILQVRIDSLQNLILLLVAVRLDQFSKSFAVGWKQERVVQL